MKLRTIKVMAVDEDGVLLDSTTLKIDPAWTGIGLKACDPDTDVRSDAVLDLGRPE